MNNMNIELLEKDVCSKFQVLNIDNVSNNQISFDVENNEVHSVLSYLKSIGWIQLSLLTCVDWIKDNKFQLVYIIFNWEMPIRIQVRTLISREDPIFRTITTIYTGAKYYERDVHEQFGVVFEGNPESLKQLFLEEWDDMPPLRKDFDPKAYSDRKYSKREYKANYETKKDGDKQ